MTSHLEQQFADLWLSLYPTLDLRSEYRFSPPRRYRWDFCHLESKVAIEIQGGVWMRKSGHSGGTGILKDYEKLCLAAAEGWRVFLLADSMINNEYLGSIATAISAPELTAIIQIDEIAVNCPESRSRQRDYIGCISPKQIKGIIYHYWVYHDRGKRKYRCLGTDRASAVVKAKVIYDLR